MEIAENKQKKLEFLRCSIRSDWRQKKRYHTDTIVIIARMFWKLIQKVVRKLVHFPNNVGNFFDAPDFQLSKCIFPSPVISICFASAVKTRRKIFISNPAKVSYFWFRPFPTNFARLRTLYFTGLCLTLEMCSISL